MTWYEHGPGVFSKRYASLDLNIGVVVCEGGLLVIDTRAHRRQARELLADLGQISPLPIRWVINTHHHWDHTFGNGEFTTAEIWGHERCARYLVEHGETMLELIQGVAFDDPDLAAPGGFDEVVLVPPDHTFADMAAPDFGGRRIEMTYLGRGHTDNDIVIRVAGSDVIFAGDLVEEGAPPSYGDAFPLEWPATVARLLEMTDGTIVPGHGAPVDSGFVRAQHDDLASVARLAAERHADGMAPEQAAAAGGPFPQATLAAAFGRAWEHLDGDPAGSPEA